MCMNVYLCINEWIYLIAYVGAGSWSFRGVQAIVLGSEKLALCDLEEDASILPGGCSGFIVM